MQEFEKCVSQMEADMDSANAPLRQTNKFSYFCILFIVGYQSPSIRPSLPSWALPEDHKKNWPMIGNCTGW